MRRNNTLQCDPHTSHGFCTLYCAKFNYFLPDFLFTVKNVHKLHSYHFMRAERANNWERERTFYWIYRTISIRLLPLSCCLEGTRARRGVKMSPSQIVNITGGAAVSAGVTPIVVSGAPPCSV